MTGRGLAFALAAILIAGCATTSEPYFQEPDRTGISAPRPTGQSVYVGVAWLVANEGDDVRLLSAEALDTGAGSGSLAWYALQLSSPDRLDSIGITGADDPLADELAELAGARVATGPRNNPTAVTQVVAAIRGDDPGVISFRAVRLRFTVNGQERTQDFPMAVALCVDDPAPAECSPPDA